MLQREQVFRLTSQDLVVLWHMFRLNLDPVYSSLLHGNFLSRGMNVQNAATYTCNSIGHASTKGVVRTW